MTRAKLFFRAAKPAPAPSTPPSADKQRFTCWHCRQRFLPSEVVPVFLDEPTQVCLGCAALRGPQIEAARKYHASRRLAEQRRDADAGMRVGAVTILAASFVLTGSIAYLSGNDWALLPLTLLYSALLVRVLTAAKASGKGDDEQ